MPESNEATPNPDGEQNTGPGESQGNTDGNQANVQGIPQDKVNEIVQQRVARERAQWQEKFEGIDPERAREALSRLDEIEDKKLMDQEQFRELLDKKTSKFEQERAEWSEKYTALEQKFRNTVIDRALFEAASRAVKPAHVASLLRDHVNLDDDGNPVVTTQDGKVMLDDDGAPIQVSQFVDAWLDENDHFLPASPGRGAGSDGPNDRPGGSTAGPGTFDPRQIAAEAQKRYDKARTGRN